MSFLQVRKIVVHQRIIFDDRSVTALVIILVFIVCEKGDDQTCSPPVVDINLGVLTGLKQSLLAFMLQCIFVCTFV